MKWLRALLIMPVFLMAVPAQAEPVTYIPPGCDFQISFPDEPLTEVHCAPDNPFDCNSVTSYIKVYGIDASVVVELSCFKAEKEMFGKFTGPVMQATLAGMVSPGQLENVKADYLEFENAKQAIVMGTGSRGISDMIYTAQLWISENSIFTIEGKLIGIPIEEADKLFANILNSIRHKTGNGNIIRSGLSDMQKPAPDDTALRPEDMQE